MQKREWHAISIEAVASIFNVSVDAGLSNDLLDRLRDKYGSNTLTQKRAKSSLELFIQQFNQPLVIILIAAAVGTAFLQEWVDCGVISAVVLVNALTGYIQENKAIHAIRALSKQLNFSATVRRQGVKEIIKAIDLVPGDVVLLSSGDKVPADLRLVQTKNLQIEEAPLTGESVPVQKNEEQLLSPDAPIGDRVNMAYSSTLVTYGTGIGIVTEIGDQTEVGKINQLLGEAENLETPLTKRISRLSLLLLYVILTLSTLTFIAGYMRGASLEVVFLQAVALAVGAVPEGLPAVITITLAIGVSKLAKQHAIIRKLPAVETLGSTTVICSDKTGTLTQNQMMVTNIWTKAGDITVTGNGYETKGAFVKHEGWKLSDDLAAEWVLKVGLLCNESVLKKEQDVWSVQGNPTEGALIASALKVKELLKLGREDHPIIDLIPFESAYKYMGSLHKIGGKKYLLLKGSVEGVLKVCGQIMSADGSFLDIEVSQVEKKVEELASQGLRVLAFAMKEVPLEVTSIDHEDLNNDLCFLGLQAMIDPPRLEVVSAIDVCQKAGIDVKMITGDHIITAKSIAEKLGFKVTNNEGVQAVEGINLVDTTGEGLTRMVVDNDVFARVTPKQKYDIVKALQEMGHVVAMTGDGVNDAPALKQADIGIAMGITGTEVSKDASDMVLANDNFSSIVAAVEEGRGIFDNLVKFITWTLPTNLSEGLVILVAVFLGRTIPVSPLQILWINMTTAVLLGMMLAFEKKDMKVMTRQPRKPNSPVIDRVLGMRILWVGLVLVFAVYFVYERALLRGMTIEAARTVAANMLVFGELFYLFNCRSLRSSMFVIGVFSNRWVWYGAFGMVVLQLLFTYASSFNFLFKTEPIGYLSWIDIIVVSIALYLLVEIEKMIQERFGKT